MAKKKVMLFIVEGSTDEISLSTVLSRIFNSSTIKFQVVHGDILTRDFTAPDKIVAAVWEQVKAFMGNIYNKSDICRIVHLTDTDGVFIPDAAVVYDASMGSKSPPFYMDTQIQTPNVESIRDRNQRKRNNINRLSACPKISGIPYSMYYFSLNLDHVLHGKTNLSNWEKIQYAEEFDLKYGDDPEGFTFFMKESVFSVCDDYRSSWAFIKTECHSLERYSNFGIELPPINATRFEAKE